MCARVFSTIVSLTVSLILPILALAGTSPAASAQTVAPIQPRLGNWEIIQELTAEQVASIAEVPPRALERMGYDPAAKVLRTTLCLNKQAMSRWADQDRAIRETGKAQCAAPEYAVTGDAMTMTITCTAPVALRVRTLYRFNRARDAYDYENEATIRTGKDAVTQRVRGRARRIGDC